MRKIAISQAKRFMEDLGLTHIAIFGVYEDGTQCVATHGGTTPQAREAARAGNKLKAALGWPESQCNATMLPRRCENCTKFVPDRGIHTFTGWTLDGSVGHCYVEPVRVGRGASDPACRHFDPHA